MHFKLYIRLQRSPCKCEMHEKACSPSNVDYEPSFGRTSVRLIRSESGTHVLLPAANSCQGKIDYETAAQQDSHYS